MYAIDPGETIRYIPKCDRELPTEEQVIFLYRPLTAKEAADIQDRLTETTLGGKAESTMRIYSGSQQLKALQSGMKGWENFKDKKGKAIEWRDNNGTPRNENFDRIPADVRQELAQVIIEGGEVSEKDAKK
jgi:hypothetical protein